MTLEKACELMPEEEGDEGGAGGGPEQSAGEGVAVKVGQVGAGTPAQKEGGGTVSPTQQNKQRMRRR